MVSARRVKKRNECDVAADKTKKNEEELRKRKGREKKDRRQEGEERCTNALTW